MLTRGQRLRALLLVAPLLVLLLLSFCLPIVALLARAVYDPTMADALPRTAAALSASPGSGVPGDAAFAALGEDLLAAKANDSGYDVAKDLNNLLPAARWPACCGRRAGCPPTRHWRVRRWWRRIRSGDPDETWFAIRTGMRPFTLSYLLSAVDLRWLPQGGIGPVPRDEAIYRAVFTRTFSIAAGSR